MNCCWVPRTPRRLVFKEQDYQVQQDSKDSKERRVLKDQQDSKDSIVTTAAERLHTTARVSVHRPCASGSTVFRDTPSVPLHTPVPLFVGATWSWHYWGSLGLPANFVNFNEWTEARRNLKHQLGPLTFLILVNPYINQFEDVPSFFRIREGGVLNDASVKLCNHFLFFFIMNKHNDIHLTKYGRKTQCVRCDNL